MVEQKADNLGQLKIERRKVDEEINHLRKQIETCGPGTTIRERYAGVRCVAGLAGRQVDRVTVDACWLHSITCQMRFSAHTRFCVLTCWKLGRIVLIFRKLLRIYGGYSSLYQTKQV